MGMYGSFWEKKFKHLATSICLFKVKIGLFWKSSVFEVRSELFPLVREARFAFKSFLNEGKTYFIFIFHVLKSSHVQLQSVIRADGGSGGNLLKVACGADVRTLSFTGETTSDPKTGI